VFIGIPAASTYDSKTSHAQRLSIYNIILRSRGIRVEQFYNEICTSPRRYNYYNTIISMTIVLAYCGKAVVKQSFLPALRIFSSLYKLREIGIFSPFVMDYYCLRWTINLVEFKSFSRYKKEIACNRPILFIER